jgi:hypothetical protein
MKRQAMVTVRQVMKRQAMVTVRQAMVTVRQVMKRQSMVTVRQVIARRTLPKQSHPLLYEETASSRSTLLAVTSVFL